MARSLIDSLLATSTAKLLLIDPESGEIVDGNAPAASFYGKSREELLGCSVMDLSAQPAELVLDELKCAARGDPLKLLGRRQFVADGVRDVEIHASLVRIDDRGLLLSIVHDVSGQRAAEAALAHERAYSQQLVEASSDGIAVLDRDGRIRRTNRGFLRVFGYAAEESRGRTIDELIVPPQFHEEAAELAARTLGGEVTQRDSHRSHKDGYLVPVTVTGVPIELENEQVGVFAIYHNISHRVAAENALRQSEAKFRALFEESKDVIYITNMDGAILDVNPAGVELFEYRSREEMLSLNTSRDFYVDSTAHQKLIETVRSEGFVRDYEAVMKTRSGRRLTIQDTCIATRDEEGRVSSLRGFMRDVTQQRQLEDQLRNAQKMEALGRLAGGVSHDFNNLLMVIESYCALLEDRLRDDESAREDLTEIRRASDRAASLTRQLLAFSRSQMRTPRSLSLNTVVSDMEALLRRVLGEDVQLTTDFADELWPVCVDAGQIQQVLINFAVNARDAMRHGGEFLIETENVVLDSQSASQHHDAQPGSWVRLVVSDTGVGIDSKAQERIFEPFYTTKDVGHGTGLGLSAVYGIIQQSGGFIEVASRPGDGAAFLVYFPRDGNPRAEVKAPRSRTLLPTGNETILLVEDEGAVRKPLRRFLEAQGYEVLEAEDGALALELSCEFPNKIDLLLTDVVMPRLGGSELAETLVRRIPGLKVLFISGYSFAEAPAKSLAGRPFSFLQKPFSPSTLVRVVRETLDSA